MASEIAKEIKYPPLPENPSYPDFDPDHLPPKQMLDVSVTELDDEETVHFQWDYTSPPYFFITAFELYYYEQTDAAYDLSHWKYFFIKFDGVYPASKYIPITEFNRNRRYFFSIRGKDFQRRYGPFSDQICIDF